MPLFLNALDLFIQMTEVMFPSIRKPVISHKIGRRAQAIHVEENYSARNVLREEGLRHQSWSLSAP